MNGQYDSSLVALSILIASIASYTALDLAGCVSANTSSPRKSWTWLIAGAVSMGSGIWSMHFIGMLAFHLPVPVAYDLPITLLSLFIAIVVSAIALLILRRPKLEAKDLIIGAILMGIGISAMHYTGMFAMQMSPAISYDPLIFVASVLIAMGASLAALWIALQLRTKRSKLAILAKLGSASVMGLAITGMHYTGMAAAHFAPGSFCITAVAGGISNTMLAIAIGGSTVVILSLTLIVSALDAHFALNNAKLARALEKITLELKEAQGELLTAQKLESVGRLAAGIAHEINTPVQFVSDNLQFIRTSMTDVAAVIQAYRNLKDATQSSGEVVAAAQLADEAEKSADLNYILQNTPEALDSSIEGLGRIATIVRSMKEFAHPDQTHKTSADLNQAIRSTLIVANHEYKLIAKVDMDLGDLPPVPCFLGEINQVVLNLLVNASHAISDVVKDGGGLGKLTVRTRLDGNEVEISISDTGTGIPESARDKIFDPFFTTKEVGKGTGQGLAIARSVIVNKHGGTLRFETESGKGTTFFIRLPIEAPIEMDDATRAAA
jgi:two-component system, NtrC family, sensor kinase